MIAQGVTPATVQLAAARVNVRLVGLNAIRNGVHFTLGLNGETWRRRNHFGRRVAAVCWHGHRAFMIALFAFAPNAVLKSTMVTYKGRMDFYANHDVTGDRNIGSIAQPLSYRRACDCPVEVT